MFVQFTTIRTTIILVYVDDIIISGSDKKLINDLHMTFSKKDLDAFNYFLGIHVTRIGDTLHL